MLKRIPAFRIQRGTSPKIWSSTCSSKLTFSATGIRPYHATMPQQQQQQQQQQEVVHQPSKSFLTRLMDRWSIRGQQESIRIGEELFQAATRQADDP
jgi:hypothetical protein